MDIRSRINNSIVAVVLVTVVTAPWAQEIDLVADDATRYEARHYEAGRRGAQDIARMGATDPQKFEQICKATRPLQP